MDFYKQGGHFMRPNLDTFITANVIRSRYGRTMLKGERGGEEAEDDAGGSRFIFQRAIDVGAGSGWLAKSLALSLPSATVVALDTCKEAIAFMKSPYAAMPSNVRPRLGCALEQQYSAFDLIICNPPYIPTEEECRHVDSIDDEADGEREGRKKREEKATTPQPLSFWKGTGLICGLLDRLVAIYSSSSSSTYNNRLSDKNDDHNTNITSYDNNSATANRNGTGITDDNTTSNSFGPVLLLNISSVSLKSQRVCAALRNLPSHGVSCRVLKRAEVGFKTSILGQKHQHLMAEGKESVSPVNIAGMELFVGLTDQSQPRIRGKAEMPKLLAGLAEECGHVEVPRHHWQVLHSVEFSPTPNSTN